MVSSPSSPEAAPHEHVGGQPSEASMSTIMTMLSPSSTISNRNHPVNETSNSLAMHSHAPGGSPLRGAGYAVEGGGFIAPPNIRCEEKKEKKEGKGLSEAQSESESESEEGLNPLSSELSLATVVESNEDDSFRENSASILEDFEVDGRSSEEFAPIVGKTVRTGGPEKDTNDPGDTKESRHSEIAKSSPIMNSKGQVVQAASEARAFTTTVEVREQSGHQPVAPGRAGLSLNDTLQGETPPHFKEGNLGIQSSSSDSSSTGGSRQDSRSDKFESQRELANSVANHVDVAAIFTDEMRSKLTTELE